jgi:HK97 family phage major capsid protein
MAINTSSNSTLHQDIVQRILVGPMAQTATVLGLGIQEFVSDGSEVHLPRLDSIGTAVTHVAEGAEIPEASVATSEVVLLPSTVQPIKTLVKMTNESLSSSVVNLEAAMGAAITTRVGALVDAALYNGGTATTGSPVGIFQMTGFTNAGTAAGTALAPSNLYDMQEDYSLAYGSESSAIWMMHPTTLKYIRLMEDTAGQRVLQPSLAQGAPSTILGMPYVVTSHAPTTALALVDRAQLAIGRAPASVTVLDQTFADYDITALRVVVRYDIQPRNAAAIVKLTIT